MRTSRSVHPFSRVKQLNIGFVLVVSIIFLVVILPVAAQTDLSGNAVDGFPVVLDGKEVFRVRHGLPEGITAEERANAISQRLQRLASDPTVKIDASQPPFTQRSISYTAPSQTDKGITVVKADNATSEEDVLFTARDQDVEKLRDANGNPLTRQELAENNANAINEAIKEYKLNRQKKQTALTIFGGLLLLLLLLFVLLKLFNRFLRQRNTPPPQWLNSNRWMQWGVIPLTLLGFLALSLLGLSINNSMLPDFITNEIIQQFQSMAESFIQYLPNLVMLIVIVCLTFVAIALARLVIKELGEDNRSAWFDPEWIHPTVSLATILISTIGGAIALPYLPGFGSPMFLSVLIILGILFVLSSYSIVANAIAGLVLIYSSKWSGLKDGQEVALTNPMGQLITAGTLEKSLLVSRLRLSTGQQILVPNSSLLNSYVTLQSPPENPPNAAEVNAPQI